MQSIRRLLALTAVVFAASGCWWGHKSESQPPRSTPSTLTVENHHWLDANIYVMHDGQRSRLGTATAARTLRLTFPPSFLGQLGTIQLIADPVGASAGIVSQSIVLKPGTRVVWTLESDLSRSSLAVY
jgi:hypothetical protein